VVTLPHGRCSLAFGSVQLPMERRCVCLGADAMLDLGHTAVVTANKQKRRNAHDHQKEAVEGSLAALGINAYLERVFCTFPM
jgi:hypothetical protein